MSQGGGLQPVNCDLVSASSCCVHTCTAHTVTWQWPACGQGPCASADTHRPTHTHWCAEANLQKPVVTRPTPSRCIQWFLSITAGWLFNSITRGPAAGLASCLEVDLRRRPAPDGHGGHGGASRVYRLVSDRALGPRGTSLPHRAFPDLGTTHTLGLMENHMPWGPPTPPKSHHSLSPRSFRLQPPTPHPVPSY